MKIYWTSIMAAVAVWGALVMTGHTQPVTPPEKGYTLTGITAEEINSIGRGLAKLPYEEVARLLVKLQSQVDEQNKATKK